MSAQEKWRPLDFEAIDARRRVEVVRVAAAGRLTRRANPDGAGTVWGYEAGEGDHFDGEDVTEDLWYLIGEVLTDDGDRVCANPGWQQWVADQEATFADDHDYPYRRLS